MQLFTLPSPPSHFDTFFYSEVAQAGIPLQSVSNDYYRYLNGLDDSHCHCSGCGRGDDDFLMMPEGARRRHNDDAAHHHIIFFREQVRERNVQIAQSSPVKKRGRETIQGWFRNQSQPSRPPPPPRNRFL